ncbi:hypothetical protein [Actinomadura sp. 6N118]|uniref:hypothetical protein n=1 Tax=Actinomadura sp. 6N118 TaxID=3375151 RepID=UPI00378B83E3
MTTTKTAERIESTAQILILLAVASMAGAASFTHVHDWTMTNSPPGTGDWFGWANAVISELTPTAAALEIRRRKRHGHPVGYPMTVLILAAGLSIAAQLAVAEPTPVGWLLSAVPALAFLALTKLVLSTPALTSHNPIDNEGQHDDAVTVHAAAQQPPALTQPTDQPTTQPVTQAVPAQLVTGARMADHIHRQTHGHPIGTLALAEHLGIDHTLATAVLNTLNGDTTNDNDASDTGGRP